MRLCLFILILFTSCQSSERPTRFENNAMTMSYCIQIGEPLTSNQRKKIEQVIHSTFNEVDEIFNHYNPNSFISQFNLLSANERIVSPPLFLELIKEVDQLVVISEGRFDPTIAPLLTLWKKRLKEGQLPSQNEIDLLLPAIGWSHIHTEDVFLWKDHDQTALDLSGTAKGFAVDLLTERLQKLGFQNLYVEWGGEIRTLGKHSKDRPWRIAITGGEVVELYDQAIATSGSYLQNWVVDGKTYSHIIDPTTHQPIEMSSTAIVSASVICEKCSQADGLATTLMLFQTAEDGQNWAKTKISDHTVLIIDRASWSDRPIR